MRTRDATSSWPHLSLATVQYLCDNHGDNHLYARREFSGARGGGVSSCRHARLMQSTHPISPPFPPPAIKGVSGKLSLGFGLT